MTNTNVTCKFNDWRFETTTSANVQMINRNIIIVVKGGR